MSIHSRVDAPPRILLAGLGRFGRQHLAVWRSLEQEGLVRLCGALVRSPPREDPGVRILLDPDELDISEIDAIDIVTPASTHAALVRRFLPHVHVLVEKPLATAVADALAIEELTLRSSKSLMVNHLYRVHPSVIRMSEIVQSYLPELPLTASVKMVNPVEPGVLHRAANLEFLHVFDILDALSGGAEMKVLSTQRSGHLFHSSVLCGNGLKALVEFGWEGDDRVRTIELRYQGCRYSADLLDTSILRRAAQGFERISGAGSARTLEPSLRAFVRAISEGGAVVADARLGRSMVEVALSATPKKLSRRPRVAVIGAGIFGVSCALELAQSCDVTLIERHGQIFTEATFNNQWRHHSGFHYPRSLETVKEIRSTRDVFRAAYGHGVIRDIPSYYCTSVRAREITRDRYLAACRAGGLDFTETNPPDGVLDPTQIDLCVRTDEGVFDYRLLLAEVQRRLNTTPLSLRLDSSVVGARLEPTGEKILKIRDQRGEEELAADYVINATYANMNQLACWLGLPIELLRFDLCEILVLELDLPPVAVTVLDGPFTSLVGTGEPGEFLLSHIHESILRSDVTANGLPPAWSGWTSNRDNLLRHCSRYLPVVQHAKIKESRFAIRAVRALTDDYDGRPTVLRSHGFGCWSVLGGKIVTSVSTARSLARKVQQRPLMKSAV